MESSGSQPDELMRDASDAEPPKNQEINPESNDDDEEIDNSKLPWGKKRPIKDLEKMVDWDIVQSLYPQGSEELKKYLGEIPRKGLNDPKRFLKPTPLDLLPASHRTVFVQKDQFERLKRDKEIARAERKAAGEMDIDEPEISTLSVAELEYLVEDLMGEEVRKRKEEELEMWMIQEDEKQTIYKTLNKEQRRDSLHNLEARASKAVSDTQSSAKRFSLPILRTNNLVQQLEAVTIRTAAPTPASPHDTPRSAGKSIKPLAPT
ncbi:hypothetical protein AA313_de0208697 [Arthrobotrys entomopaga]|nr:hypothetical protein AA313_de0208697 [Arthrobotrys entomopaga]